MITVYRKVDYLEDINKMCQMILGMKVAAPSGYAYPAIVLNEARVYLGNDLRRCSKLTKKAYNLYQKESEAALLYNKIDFSHESSELTAKREMYLECIRKGNYRKAKNIAKEALRLTGKSVRELLDVCVDSQSGAVLLQNHGGYDMVIESVSIKRRDTESIISHGGATIVPNGVLKIEHEPVPSGLVVTVRYIYNGPQTERTFVVGGAS